jgi:hypothetical protein
MQLQIHTASTDAKDTGCTGGVHSWSLIDYSCTSIQESIQGRGAGSHAQKQTAIATEIASSRSEKEKKKLTIWEVAISKVATVAGMQGSAKIIYPVQANTCRRGHIEMTK